MNIFKLPVNYYYYYWDEFSTVGYIILVVNAFDFSFCLCFHSIFSVYDNNSYTNFIFKCNKVTEFNILR